MISTVFDYKLSIEIFEMTRSRSVWLFRCRITDSQNQ